ncbi:putative intraflagellar transport protein [Paratrimastix pyriformis]|uniref:Intraflagellar transport protein n=1 Tax=Paratrimastix pyriformis TaxID=342808 RepID=A0ABQ8URT2_9EUKA|nr:putative intraflagellar transport protein [Paratrimastix pyriformis]
MQTYVTSWPQIRCAQFHTIVPIFAIGSENKVSLCNEEGEPVEEFQTRKAPVQLAWNPHSTVLACGCEDGIVYIYHHKNLWQDDSVHNAPFRFMKWNPEGTRLVVGDESGLLSVWRMDTPGRLVPAFQQKFASPFCTCCFRVGGPPLAQPTPTEGEKATPFRQPTLACFVATQDGSLGLITDDKYTFMTSVHGQPAVLLYLAKKDTLVCITKSMNMHRLQYDPVEGQTTGKHVKLNSTSDTAGLLDACWVAPGLLATISAESMVRVWDLLNDENYVLTLTAGPPRTCLTADSKQTTVSFNDRVTCMAFEPNSRSLLCPPRHATPRPPVSEIGAIIEELSSNNPI